MEPKQIEFFIRGEPQPGGSKKVFFPLRNGALILMPNGYPVHNVVDDSTHGGEWRNACKRAGKRAVTGWPLKGALSVAFRFIMPRPKYHFHKRTGELLPDAPFCHTIAPDTTKLIRSTEDALTGIAWEDDCIISGQSGSKVYGPNPGCHVAIEVIDPLGPAKVVAPLFANV